MDKEGLEKWNAQNTLINFLNPKITLHNIKCSAKVKTNLKLHDIIDRCLMFSNLRCILHTNFVVIKKTNSSVRIVFFKERYDRKSHCHANLTGLRNFPQVQNCISLLAAIIGCDRNSDIIYKIENLSGTSDIIETFLSQHITVCLYFYDME